MTGGYIYIYKNSLTIKPTAPKLIQDSGIKGFYCHISQLHDLIGDPALQIKKEKKKNK